MLISRSILLITICGAVVNLDHGPSNLLLDSTIRREGWRIHVSIPHWVEYEMKEMHFGNIPFPLTFQSRELEKWGKNGKTLSTPDDYILFLGMHYLTTKATAVDIMVISTDGKFSEQAPVVYCPMATKVGEMDPGADVPFPALGEDFTLGKIKYKVTYDSFITSVNNTRKPPALQLFLRMKIELTMRQNKIVHEATIPVFLQSGEDITIRTFCKKKDG
jgi:hypothetical protein